MGSVSIFITIKTLNTRNLIKAPAKLNLHLEVLGLRADGFHELAMVMQSIDLFDLISVEAADPGVVLLESSDPQLAVDQSNLVVKAAHALKTHCGRPELAAKLQLKKNIPIGAGLAGGSSDAASTLLLLNRFWQLDVSMLELQLLAAELGSDVPFCLSGGTQYCFGRGEKLEPLPSTPALGVLLIKDPSAQVSTPWAYSQCRQLRQEFYLDAEQDFENRRAQLRQKSNQQWHELRNDLQEVVAPSVASVRSGLALLKSSAELLGCAMSGSGPSLFGLFLDRSLAYVAEQQLLPALRKNGFDHWVCEFEPARNF